MKISIDKDYMIVIINNVSKTNTIVFEVFESIEKAEEYAESKGIENYAIYNGMYQLLYYSYHRWGYQNFDWRSLNYPKTDPPLHGIYIGMMNPLYLRDYHILDMICLTLTVEKKPKMHSMRFLKISIKKKTGFIR